MNSGRNRLLALRKETAAVSKEMEIEADRYRFIESKGPSIAVSAFQLFQTPEAIADRMAAMLVSLCDLSDDTRILEPSAGLGRLYRALRYRTQAHITLVEIAPQCAAELYRETAGDGQTTLIQSDFLDCTAERIGRVDAVLMNPPFKNGRDIKHCRHAYELLESGGVIVSLCYAGPRQRAAFENVDGWTWELLPAGSFKTEGTGAEVAMVWKRKA